jgi:hypothetical protein
MTVFLLTDYRFKAWSRGCIVNSADQSSLQIGFSDMEMQRRLQCKVSNVPHSPPSMEVSVISAFCKSCKFSSNSLQTCTMACKYSSLSFDPSLLASVLAVVMEFEISLPFMVVPSNALRTSSTSTSISSAGTFARCFCHSNRRTVLPGLEY